MKLQFSIENDIAMLYWFILYYTTTFKKIFYLGNLFVIFFDYSICVWSMTIMNINNVAIWSNTIHIFFIRFIFFCIVIAFGYESQNCVFELNISTQSFALGEIVWVRCWNTLFLLPIISINSIGRIGPEAPLECYECNSIHDGESCYNFNKNDTSSQIDPRFKKQCPSDKPYCKVSTARWVRFE